MPAGELFVDTAYKFIVQESGNVDLRLGLPEKQFGQLLPAHGFIGAGVVPETTVICQLFHRYLRGRFIMLFVEGKTDIQLLQGIRQTEGIGDLADELSAEKALGLI